ncbi:MAG: hypothetical protein EPO10_29020 [Reyranella sp.]|nr:MAG: hypothetical protein EPO10_29020 [Reyranella sp.]
MKKDVLNGILNALIRDRLSPTPTERTRISTEYEFLCAVVGGVCFQSGSYARFTSTTPVNDLDVIWQVPESALDREVIRKSFGPNGSAQYDPSLVLARLAEKLKAAYRATGRNVTVMPQSHSVGIYFGSKEDFSIDLVPAIASGRRNSYGADIYWVPEIADLSHQRRSAFYETHRPMGWLLSDPRGYIESARELNEANPAFRKSAKFGRKWRKGCKKSDPALALKSFHLELMVDDILRRLRGGTVVDALKALFDEMPVRLGRSQFPDRADPSRFVDEYVMRLTPAERESILKRARVASSLIDEMLLPSSGDADVRRLIDRILDGTAVAAVTAPAIAASSSYTPRSTFQPPRNYGRSDQR